MITLEQLQQIADARSSRFEKYIDPLNAAMVEFDINTVQREEYFIAQILHESERMIYVREIASGAAYEGRKDLGNLEPGDGIRFKGRGLIQITGRANYEACGLALDLPLRDQPELLEAPSAACRSAGWFWKTHGLNEIADAGDFIKATKRINGGINGLADRQAYLARAQQVIG